MRNRHRFPLLYLGLILAGLAPLAANADNPSPGSDIAPAPIPDNLAWAKNHPRIVLTPDVKARIQERIRDDPEVAELWANIKTVCDGYIDPNSLKYIDQTKAYDDYLKMQGGSHEKQLHLETSLRHWLNPLDLLCFAYAVSGDERYGKKAAALAVVTAQKLNPTVMGAGFEYTSSFPTRSLALTLDWCYPMFTPAERDTVRQSLGVFVSTLYYDNFHQAWGESSLGRIWNWNAGISSAWGLGALALEGETNYPARQWLFQAERNVEDYLRFAVDDEGGTIEGPQYFGYGCGFLPYFVEGLKARTGDDLYATTHYNLFATWLPLEMLPGGHRVNNLLDSDFKFVTTDALLYSLYREPDRPLARYLWEQFFLHDNVLISYPAAILWAPEPIPAADVAARAATLPDYGWAAGRSVVISRSGAGPEDAYFTIHAQHYTQTRHDQADKGEFTLYAYGDDLAIDSGKGNDSNKQKSTSGYAHNQVMVDGQPEIMGGNQAQTDGWIVDSLHAPLVDLSVLDIADAYRFYYTRGSDPKDPTPVYKKVFVQEFQKADRLALFIRKPFPYAVIFDDMKKDEAPHAYTWMLHAANGMTFQHASTGIQVAPQELNPTPIQITGAMPAPTVESAHKSAWLQVSFVFPTQWEEKVDSFQTTQEGFHPRLSVTATPSTVRGQFLTFLIPHPLVGGQLTPATAIEPVPATKGHAGKLAVSGDTTDLLACWDGTGIETADVETDANLLWLRRDASGNIIAAAASNATHVNVAGRRIFTCNSGKADFVFSDGTAVVPDKAAVQFDLGNIKVETFKRSPDWMAVPPVY